MKVWSPGQWKSTSDTCDGTPPSLKLKPCFPSQCSAALFSVTWEREFQFCCAFIFCLQVNCLKRSTSVGQENPVCNPITEYWGSVHLFFVSTRAHLLVQIFFSSCSFSFPSSFQNTLPSSPCCVSLCSYMMHCFILFFSLFLDNCF